MSEEAQKWADVAVDVLSTIEDDAPGFTRVAYGQLSALTSIALSLAYRPEPIPLEPIVDAEIHCEGCVCPTVSTLEAKARIARAFDDLTAILPLSANAVKLLRTVKSHALTDISTILQGLEPTDIEKAL